MSKGTVRYPESAIADGRVGTARIREEIARAAHELATVDMSPLRGAIKKLVSFADALPLARAVAAQTGQTPEQVIVDFRAADYSHAASPLERMQALGRLGRGRMNKTEQAYVAEVLDPELHAGVILWFRFEAIKLRLADNTFLTVDSPVIAAAGELEFREVKGRWTDDARAKIKVAAAQFPWRFYAIHRVGRHGWRTEDLTSHSW